MDGSLRTCGISREAKTARSRDRVLLALLFGLAASPLRAQAQTEAARWTFAGFLRETFNDNLFLTSPPTASEEITGANCTLGYSRVDPHSSLTALGWAGGSFFNQFDSYSGGQFGLGATGRVSVSPRLQLQLAASYADGLNLDSFLGSRIGTPQLDLKSGYGSLGLTFAFTPSTSAHALFDGSGIRYRAGVLFDSVKLPGDSLIPPDVRVPLGTAPSNPDALVAPESSQQALGLLSSEELRVLNLDYWSWRASTGLIHEFSPETRLTLDAGYRQTYVSPQTYPQGTQIDAQAALREVLDQSANLSFAYGYQDSQFQFHFRTHAFTVQGVKQFSQKVRGDASIGVSYLDGPHPTAGFNVIGGGGISAQFKRTLLVARYTRTRYQGLVTGDNQVTDVVYASIGHTLTRHVSLSAFGFWGDGQDDLTPLYSYSRAMVGASVTARIKKRGIAGVSYSYLEFHNQGRPSAESSVVALFLGYTRTMR